MFFPPHSPSQHQGLSRLKKSIHLHHPTLLDILVTFPSCHPPLNRILDCLTLQKPRYYSIATTPLLYPSDVFFAFNVVEHVTPDPFGFKRVGCTHWLDALSGNVDWVDDLTGVSVDPTSKLFVDPKSKLFVDSKSKLLEQNEMEGGQQFSSDKKHPDSTFALPGSNSLESSSAVSPHHSILFSGMTPLSSLKKIAFFPRVTTSFHLPTSHDVPIILIGPGTGVSPFIGFLQHRCAANATGRVWVFYGCRDRRVDFLFRDQLTNVQSNLIKVHVAESRRPGSMFKYVQDALYAHRVEILHAIEELGAKIYVCGDSKKMSQDVQEQFVKIICELKSLDVDSAMHVVMKWLETEQYVREVWS